MTRPTVQKASEHKAAAIDQLKMLKEGEPGYYRTMGNGYYSGADFIELGEKSGLIEKTVKKRISTLAGKVKKAAPAIIEASFMPEDMKARY